MRLDRGVFRLYIHIAYYLPFKIFLLGATSLYKLGNGLGKMLIHMMEMTPKCYGTENDYTINTRQDKIRICAGKVGITTKQVDIP